MKIQLHPEAAKNFDKKAEALVTSLVKFFYKGKLSEQPGQVSFQPDIYAKVVHPVSVKEGTSISLNETGKIDGMVLFRERGHSMGLSKENWNEWKKLVEQLQNNQALTALVSGEFLGDVLLEWLQKTYYNTVGQTFSEYLIGECGNSIKDLEIWIPIAQTHVEDEISIGRVTIKTLSKSMFDEWIISIKEHWSKNPAFKDEDLNGAESVLEQKRMNLQGLAAATLKVTAEPEKAWQIAREEADKAISMLRLFSPANREPTLISRCNLLGKENIESYNYLHFEGNSSFTFCSGAYPDAFQDWKIDKNTISKIKKMGLDDLHSLLVNGKKTEFQHNVLDALTLYSKSCTQKELVDKLLYMLVPMESVLLKDGNEPIMQNIAERLAFAISDNLTERKEIISNCKEVYALRSKFVHHGKSISPDQHKTLRQFMLYVLHFFLLLAKNSNLYNVKSDFIQAMDNIKLGG